MTDDAALTIPAGEVVPNSCPDTPSESPEPGLSDDSRRESKKGGAPRGNTNWAGKSLDKKAAMLLARAMKGKAKDKRTARRKGYEAESKGIAEELRLSESYPMTAKRLQRALTDTAQEIDVCQALCENRGRYEAKTGKLKPWYETVLRLRERDLSIIQKAIDDLRALPRQTGEGPVSGLLSITIAPAEAIAIAGAPCAVCSCRASAAQEPVAGVLPDGQGDPLPVPAKPAREPLAPRSVGELFRAEPVEVQVEPVPVRVEVPRRHHGFRGFAKEREIEDVPGDPSRLMF